MPVPTLKISGTETSISRLGFGCARLFAGHELRASARLVEAALEAGIRHFDTAASYAWGQSEEVLGHVLRNVPEATITTKVGAPGITGGPTAASTVYRRAVRPLLAHLPGLKSSLLKLASRGRLPEPTVPRALLTAADVERSLERSLTRLRRDRVDLFLIHDPDALTIDPDVSKTMESLRSRGLIGATGEAWGGVASGPAFGNVVQQHFAGAGHADAGPRDLTAIYHGLLRSAASRRTGLAQFAEAYVRHERCAFLFSASSPSQIAHVAEITR